MVNRKKSLINVVKGNRSKLMTGLNQKGMQKDIALFIGNTRTYFCRRTGVT